MASYMDDMALNFENYDTVVAQMRYQTFDPAGTLAALKAQNDGNFTVTKKHVVVLIYYFVTRGTRATPKKMSPEGLALFNGSFNALSCAATSPSPTAITISRLASLFAGQVALLMRKKGIQPRVTHSSLPNWLCFPQAATLLTEGGPYWNEFLEWIVKFDILINTKSNKVDAEKAKSLAVIASRNSLLSNSAKAGILTQITNTPAPAAPVAAASSAASSAAAAALP